MSVDLSKYSSLEQLCFSSVELLLDAISSNLFNQYNISSPSAPVNIEGCIFVIDLSTNAWESYQNFLSIILLLWKVWELANSVLILFSPPTLSEDLNSAGTPSSFSVFILGCTAFCLKLELLSNFIFGFSVGYRSAFLTLLQSNFFFP